MNFMNKKYILILWFLVFMMTIFLKHQLNIVLFVMTILIPILFNNINDLIEVVIIILIGTPMLNGKIAAIFTRYGINVLDILILFLFLKVFFIKILKNKNIDFKLGILDYLINIFFVLNFIAFIKGIKFNGIYSVEFKNIAFMYFLYMTLKLYDFKVNIKKLSDLIFYSVGIYSFCIFLIVVLGFVDKFSLKDYEGRVAINITLFIITITYYVYKRLNLKEKFTTKILDDFIFIIELYLLYLNQNRTIIILTTVSIVLVFIISFFDGYRNLYLKIITNIVFIFSILIIIFVVYKFMYIYIQPIVDRFLDLINKSGSYGNYLIRVNTQNYYISKILTNFSGAGWGAPMMMFPEGGAIVYLNGAIDNYFLTLGYKAGITTLIIYTLIIIICYCYILMLSIKKESLYKIYTILFPMLIIALNYYTSQAFHTITTSTLTWVLFYYFSRTNDILRKDIDKV